MHLTIVISRYEEDTHWIVSELIPLCSPQQIVVYNKGQSPCQLDSSIIQVIPLPNVGREAHTYLHHIISTYNRPNREDDVTLYIPGSCRELLYKWECVKKVIVEITKNGCYSVFPCMTCKDVDLENFTIDEHPLSHKGNAKANPDTVLKPSPIRPYGRWCREVLGRKTNTDRVTYWGIFAVLQRDIRAHPLELYMTLKYFVDHHPNHEAVHYLERAWPIVFTSSSSN